MLRDMQLVKARVTWSTAPAPTVPVLAVVRDRRPALCLRRSAQGQRIHRAPGGGHAGRHLSATLYPVRSGLQPGDTVILSGLQFLQEGVPVQPLRPVRLPARPGLGRSFVCGPVSLACTPGPHSSAMPCPQRRRSQPLARGTSVVDFFIRRPIFATVCALLIVLAGAVCIPTLPVSLYPISRRRRSPSPATTSAPTRRTSSPP